MKSTEKYVTFRAVVPLLTQALGHGEPVLLAVPARWAGRAFSTAGETRRIGPCAIWAPVGGVGGCRGQN